MVNNPNIRFAGFADEWVQCKLGKLGNTFTGLSGKTKEDFGHGDAQFVTYMNVFGNPISNPSGTERVEIDEKQNQVMYGDVFFTTSSETPEDVGMSSVWFENTESVYLNSFCFGYRPTAELDPYYLAFMLRSPTIRKKFIFLAQGISRYNISKTKVMVMEVPVPDIAEQQKLGSMFATLDHKIGLEERQISLLKDLKKGYLQKMFPKNGAKVPELRFAGFADDWEDRKLGEFSQNTIGGGTPKTSVTEYWNGEIPWIQSSDLATDKVYGVLPKKFITEDAVKNSATKLIPANSIAIVTRVGVGKLAFIPYEFASSQDFLSLSNLQVDCNFGMYSIYKMLQRELNNIQGTSIKGITKADLLNKETFVPIKVEEQQKIGNFFKQLDDTIAVSQHKLELLKDLKKGLLQQMFI